MVTFVVDPSIVASWLLPDERDAASGAARSRLHTEEAVAPGLWWFEMRNLLIVSERRGRIAPRQTERALALLANLAVRLDHAADEVSLLNLARRHRLTAYDAAYLELAVRESAPIATLGGALAKAARAEGVELVGAES